MKCTTNATTAYNFKLQCNNSQKTLYDYIKYSNDYIKDEVIEEYIVKDENEFEVAQHEEKKSKKDKIVVKSEEETDVDLNKTDKSMIQTCKNEVKVVDENIIKVSDDENVVKNEITDDETVVKTPEEVTKNSDKVKTEDDKTQNDVLGSIMFCSYCKKVFTKRYILLAHEKRHQYKGHFLCSVCGKGFNSKACLTRHIRIHTGEKKYECEICKKKFPSSNNLKLHSRTHTGIKPYLCTVCGKSFSHPTGLTYHLRTHSNFRPYVCYACGKRFSVQCHLDRHKKIHTGIFKLYNLTYKSLLIFFYRRKTFCL